MWNKFVTLNYKRPPLRCGLHPEKKNKKCFVYNDYFIIFEVQTIHNHYDSAIIN
jgi:hypothetical protein